MPLTPAERSRRYRAHAAGDHSLCPPSRDCNNPTSRETAVTPAGQSTPPPPKGLGRRGRALWTAVHEEPGPSPKPTERVLLEEACRTADRLDRLDRMLQDRETWASLVLDSEFGTSVQVRVIMNNMLSEARQQQIALKAVLGELRQSRAVSKAPAGRGAIPNASTTGTAKGAGLAGITDLSQRIRQRSGS